jgi:hypothetical protein
VVAAVIAILDFTADRPFNFVWIGGLIVVGLLCRFFGGGGSCSVSSPHSLSDV